MAIAENTILPRLVEIHSKEELRKSSMALILISFSDISLDSTITFAHAFARARYGEIIATGEAYESKQGCQNGIASAKTNAPKVQIVDMTQ
jgi:uncharacterized protein YegP (UPF0339 family)